MTTKTRPLEPAKALVPTDDPYPLPSESGIYEVSQEMASSWVSYRGGHPKLRPMSAAVAGKYQRLMETGEFREATPEGLIFDTDGYGISFQHRMKALANADPAKLTQHYGRPYLRFRIFPNESWDLTPYLDQPYRRTAAHALVGKPYAKDIGAGGKHLAALAEGDRWGMPRFNSISVPESVAMVLKWPELERWPSEVWAVWRATGISCGPHLAVLAQAARTDHRVKTAAWLEGLRTGANLSGSDPRLLLRDKFHGGFVSLGKAPKRDQVYAVIVKAWNAYVTGERLTAVGLRFRAGEEFPAVTGFDFKQAGRAA